MPNIYVLRSPSELRVKLVPCKYFKLSSNLLLTGPRWYFLCGSFLLYVFCVCRCYTVLSVSRSLMVTCWEMADLLALLCVMFTCGFVTFPYGVLGRLWYLIVSIPDFYLLPHLLFLPLFVGVLCVALLLLFSTLCPSSFAIILMGKRERERERAVSLL